MAACATPTTMIRPEFRQSDTLALDVLQQKTVGESMIEKTLLHYYPGFIAEREYSASHIGARFPLITRGQEWICRQKEESGNYWCDPTVPWGIVSLPLGVTQSASMYSLVISPEGNLVGYVVQKGTSYYFPEQPVIFKVATIPQEGSLKQELIYNGKSKDTIKIAYREFKDNFARPAFYQDLTYDMAESREIGFKGMIIEVVDATNSFIKFIVKKPMTQ